MEQLAALPVSRLTEALESWGLTPGAVRAVLERAPFADDTAVCAAVDDALLQLDEDELIHALDSVPVPSVDHGDPDALAAAMLAVQLYRDRFGFAYVSGIDTPTADELLMRVRIRLGNDPEPEGRAAREHFRRIVRRRIQRMLEEGFSR